MTSAMNRELVYLILIGINNFMEDIGRDLNSPSSHESVLSYRDKPDKKLITLVKDASKTKIIFDEIRFANIKDFNVVTETDT